MIYISNYSCGKDCVKWKINNYNLASSNADLMLILIGLASIFFVSFFLPQDAN